MPESITQFYKRIQSYDIQSDTTYSMEKPYFNIFSGNVILELCNSVIGNFIRLH